MKEDYRKEMITHLCISLAFEICAAFRDGYFFLAMFGMIFSFLILLSILKKLNEILYYKVLKVRYDHEQ